MLALKTKTKHFIKTSLPVFQEDQDHLGQNKGVIGMTPLTWSVDTGEGELNLRLSNETDALISLQAQWAEADS